MSEHTNTKRVYIYRNSPGPEGVQVYEVGKNSVTNINYNHRTVKIDFENGEHRHITGFPFEFVSIKSETFEPYQNTGHGMTPTTHSKADARILVVEQFIKTLTRS